MQRNEYNNIVSISDNTFEGGKTNKQAKNAGECDDQKDRRPLDSIARVGLSGW